MTEHASEEGSIQEDDLEEHQRTEEVGSSTETSSGDSPAYSQAEETSARPPMITPWYSDIDQN